MRKFDKQYIDITGAMGYVIKFLLKVFNDFNTLYGYLILTCVSIVSGLGYC